MPLFWDNGVSTWEDTLAGEALIQFTGNTTGPSELKFTPSGAAVCNWTVAVGRRKKAGNEWVDDGVTFYRCAAWNEMAENVAETLTDKGMRVFVSGRFHAREYEHDGQTRLSMEVQVDEVGPSLRWASANVTKAARGGGQSQPAQGQGGGWGAQGGAPAQTRQQPTQDPWAAGPGSEPPF